MNAVIDQKAAFAERLNRINRGCQFEHADVIGHHTQRHYNKIAARLAKQPQRSFSGTVLISIAFLCGMTAVLAGRVSYFHLAKTEGLPPAFYDLGERGMALFAFVLAALFFLFLPLSTRPRIMALLAGCLLMHYGEIAVAANAPEVWSQIFSPEYAASLAEQGKDYRLTPTG
ncbi:hypothetical protein OEZ60_01100 [Defluviimonas sp. WL0024]|uniref:Uncharacterized protein n=2 Tax=Albidovulum TaxID=205889 RepID=A0ABT3IYA0_9RHOB|nr:MULTISPECIES: hypothetical protein [Defluviimonas]MCU9846602.1 hypothetical protein [Defluviimonas sp. WL0024]MCW3780174.1 hypothetical protein [Defluviimonas salinarum]